MKIIRIILAQGVDLIFLAIVISLLVWYFIDRTRNFSGMLLLVVGYVINVIRNKVMLVLNMEAMNKPMK